MAGYAHKYDCVEGACPKQLHQAVREYNAPAACGICEGCRARQGRQGRELRRRQLCWARGWREHATAPRLVTAALFGVFLYLCTMLVWASRNFGPMPPPSSSYLEYGGGGGGGGEPPVAVAERTSQQSTMTTTAGSNVRADPEVESVVRHATVWTTVTATAEVTPEATVTVYTTETATATETEIETETETQTQFQTKFRIKTATATATVTEIEIETEIETETVTETVAETASMTDLVSSLLSMFAPSTDDGSIAAATITPARPDANTLASTSTTAGLSAVDWQARWDSMEAAARAAITPAPTLTAGVLEELEASRSSRPGTSAEATATAASA